MPLRLEMSVPRQGVNLALEALTAVNVMLLDEAARRGVLLPRLYDVVRYQREPPGREQWQNIVQLLRRGVGDCEDLAAAEAAERRWYDDVLASAIVVPTRRRRQLHAVVQLPDGSINDPSRLLR